MTLVACAGVRTSGLVQSDEEGALRQRATAYWEARVQERYVVEYTLLEPAVRATIPLPTFVLGRRALHFLDYTLEEIKISGGTAVVAVRVSYEADLPEPPPGMKILAPRDRPRQTGVLVREEWVKVGGTWYKRVSDATSGGPFFSLTALKGLQYKGHAKPVGWPGPPQGPGGEKVTGAAGARRT